MLQMLCVNMCFDDFTLKPVKAVLVHKPNRIIITKLY